MKTFLNILEKETTLCEQALRGACAARVDNARAMRVTSRQSLQASVAMLLLQEQSNYGRRNRSVHTLRRHFAVLFLLEVSLNAVAQQ